MDASWTNSTDTTVLHSGVEKQIYQSHLCAIDKIIIL